METGPGDVTKLLDQCLNGDSHAESQLYSLVYDHLHRLAARQMAGERPDHSLQPTALVNEMYLRLSGGGEWQFPDRLRFFAFAAKVMRNILVDHARKGRAVKRGRGQAKEELDGKECAATGSLDRTLVVDEALDRLAQLDPRQARIVELHVFGGLNQDEIAEVLGIAVRSVQREWRMAKAWLAAELAEARTESA